jgi:hypothetical protein
MKKRTNTIFLFLHAKGMFDSNDLKSKEIGKTQKQQFMAYETV